MKETGLFTPIENKKNFELILNQISNLMAAKKLLPGDKLMPERDLAQTLNVSRSSVREAFKVLEAMDLIEVKPRGGTYLKAPSVSNLFKLFPMMMLVKQHEPHAELFEIRKCVEVYAARMAASRRTEEQLDAIEKTLEQMRNIHDTEALIEGDVQFHRSITEAVGNELFQAVMEVIAGLMHYSVGFTKNMLAFIPDYNEIIFHQHSDIFNAIKDQNEARAAEAMFFHLDYSQQRVYKEFNKRAKTAGH